MRTINKKGFSILMAIGIIAVLMILVSGLAMVFLREMKLSRLSYDEVIASANAEGVFEYAMLKVRNHRDGFQDSMTGGDIDGRMFDLKSPRSRDNHVRYELNSQATAWSGALAPGDHLIVPLFVGTGTLLSGDSREPQYSTGAEKTSGLKITGLEVAGNKLNWTIMAMSGSESIGMTGSGNIDASLNNTGTIRHRDSDCYDVNGTKLISCSGGSVAQELEYFWEDTHTTIGDFIGDMTDAYVMIYNSDPATSPSRTINIMADSPFALPVYTLEAVSKKNDALQVYRFTEDKSKYLDALKYGIYNN